MGAGTVNHSVRPRRAGGVIHQIQIENPLATDNTPPSMFETVWHATARRTREGNLLGPDQALTPMEALACASREGAWLSFEEDQKGTIEPGKLADLAVLSDDPLTADAETLRAITADLTITGGQIVYDRRADGPPRPGGSGPA